MAKAGIPVVFIHGLWLHAASWQGWIDLFREHGYVPIAPSWPGIPDTVEEARAHPEHMIGEGLTEITDHYAEIIGALDRKPVVVGHSFGGLIALSLLGRGIASAAVAIDAAPIKGVLRLPLSTLRSSFPVLKNPANWNRAVPLTAEQFRWSFGNALPADESDDLYQRWAIPSPGRPLWEAALANFIPHSPAAVAAGDETRAPLLLITGHDDRVVPPSVTRAILRHYQKSPALTELAELPRRGHSLTIDHGWREVADTSLAWLSKNVH